MIGQLPETHSSLGHASQLKNRDFMIPEQVKVVPGDLIHGLRSLKKPAGATPSAVTTF